MANGVAMQVELARDAVHAPLKAEIRIERLHQIVVARVGAERSEDAVGERADLARGLTEHEAVRTEVVEVRRAPFAIASCARARGPAQPGRGRSARPMSLACGPATPAESSLSETSAATRARSRSPSLRASTGVAAAMTAVTKPVAVRTTRASSGTAAATAARSFAAALPCRLANAIARYLASLVPAPLTRKASLSGRLSGLRLSCVC